MFDIGVPELLVIGIVAMFVFGPDKLPEVARQAGRFLRTAKQLIENAKNDLAGEMGDDFAGLKDLNLRDLDPKEIVRRHIVEAMEDPEEQSGPRPGQRPLTAGETAPYDVDAT